uniref:DUF4220 domain-containing protein n=1 Tax=Oryza punctata TaxID=4537 RepID=A0A0E0L1X9_ORYPU
MEQASTKIIVQQFKYWEIQILVLLSFALQLLLFFFGGLRRRTSRVWLRTLLWLTYLSADFIAVYALGYLSRHLPTPTNDHICYQTCLGKNLLPSQSHHDFTLLWAPFFLVHLGGQDTVTAFAIEDNELWSRHLLNMIVQVCLVLYVLWYSMAHNRLVVPAAFLFVAGVIKYGERIWALKSIVQHALNYMPGLRDVFAGRELSDDYSFLYEESLDAQAAFKMAEIELSMKYDEFYTKAKVIQTRNGTILRCVSLISTVVAFVLFILMSGSKQRYYDVAITYTLFVGAFCLEACAIIITMVSPRARASIQARGGGRCSSLLTQATCRSSILPSIQPEIRLWWSNSVGQYNFVSSFLADDKSRITKMMAIVGAKELWSNFRHTRHARVTDEMKKLINQEIDGDKLREPLSLSPAFFYVQASPFEHVLFLMHLYTDRLLYKASELFDNNMINERNDTQEEEEVRSLMHTCKVISDYIFFLMLTQPAMLPVEMNVYYYLAMVSMSVRRLPTSSKEQFLEALASGDYLGIPTLSIDFFHTTPDGMWLHQQGCQGLHAALRVIVKVWVRLLIYAAGKSRPEEHARRLSMGGELLTFVWLLMAHRGLGDVYRKQFHLVEREKDGAVRTGPNSRGSYTQIYALFRLADPA